MGSVTQGERRQSIGTPTRHRQLDIGTPKGVGVGSWWLVGKVKWKKKADVNHDNSSSSRLSSWMVVVK